MEVFALLGSAKRNGSSASMTEAFLRFLPEGDHILRCRAAELDIAPCRNCGGCAGGRPCVIRDDFPIILNGIQRADVLVVAAPIYYYGMPASIKLCFDRLHAWPPSMELKQKILVLLTVSADDMPHTPRPLIDQMDLICSYRGWKLETLWLGGVKNSKDLTAEHFQQIETFAKNHITARQNKNEC